MSLPVLKAAAYTLVHTPDLAYHNGSTQTNERMTNENSVYLQDFLSHLRDFDTFISYPPNQVYIGNITAESLNQFEMPWCNHKLKNASRFGKLGELMPQDEFYLLMKLADTFDLVLLAEEFVTATKPKILAHPILNNIAEKIKAGTPLTEIEYHMQTQHSEGLYINDKLIGCVKKAHDFDPNLNAHVLLENLAVKASALPALMHLLQASNINPVDIDYVIECSEESCGDMNQRGGGNFAKAIAEMAGLSGATGSDTRGFCAAPTHALVQAASLVKAGTFKNVVIVAGGAVAKLGMNGKDHVKKELPILEDCLGAFAVLISENDGVSPIFRTDIVGRHKVGTGSSPQAVMTALVATPLEQSGLKLSDVDKYSVEMQNPDITKPAGAGNVPEANYKMIAALAVTRNEIERGDINDFIVKHGMPGWAPTQGHIPSGVPYLGFAKDDLTSGSLKRVMLVGKGSLFLGRMTNLFDGISIVLERNTGEKPVTLQTTETKKQRIGLTLFGSEHGADMLAMAAAQAMRKNSELSVVLIGTKSDISNTDLEIIEAADATSAHKIMEQMLDNGTLDGCVTMHYAFSLGISTVGKISTPSMGKEILLATTTGMASTNRVEAMVRNAIYGVITAKALGNATPTVGIINTDGANNAMHILKELIKRGYPLSLAESVREDGGSLLRGNDLLCGSSDVVVVDTLTGNMLMKILSAFTSGGTYETVGQGYGPGIGENFKRLILIISRASGAPVVAGALEYAAALAKGNVQAIAAKEFQLLYSINWQELLTGLKVDNAWRSDKSADMPPEEVVTEEILGIDVLEIESAVADLMSAGIYAKSAMGCTGPVVLVAEAKKEKALEILKGYLGE